MASRDGSGPDHLTHLARLEASPETHHIFHALRVIEAHYSDAPRFGESRRPREDAIRLGQEAELSFPPSSIRSFTAPKTNLDTRKPGSLINRFFGLFGPNGPLPIHLTEYARDRQRNHRDHTFVAFANMLTHRMMSLFYRAWVSGQPAPNFDRKNDTVERKVSAIAGYHGSALQERDGFSDLARRHFAGHLSQGPKNAEGLVSILSTFFVAPVTVQEFIGCWLELEADDRWSLGARTGLGQATSVGTQVWSRNSKFRIRIGPLNLEDYQRLLPGSQSLGRLDAIVRSYVGDALDYEVNLVLKADEVPQTQLGNSARLGQTGWIGERKSTQDADELCLSADIIRQGAKQRSETAKDDPLAA